MLKWLEKTNGIEKTTMGIYAIKNTINDKIYIGMSTGLRCRLKTHYHKLIAGKHPNDHLQSSVNRNGIENFYFELLEVHDDATDKELLIRECYYQTLYKSTDNDFGYNIQLVDVNGSVRHSDETKRKISTKGRGRTITEETRIRMSAASSIKGRISEQGRANLSKGQMGKKLKLETKDKLSKINSGNKNPNSVKLIDSNGNIHLAIMDAMKSLNLSRFQVNKLLKNGIFRRVV